MRRYDKSARHTIDLVGRGFRYVLARCFRYMVGGAAMTREDAIDEAVRRATWRRDRRTWERCIAAHLNGSPNTVALGLRFIIRTQFRSIVREAP